MGWCIEKTTEKFISVNMVKVSFYLGRNLCVNVHECLSACKPYFSYFVLLLQVGRANAPLVPHLRDQMGTDDDLEIVSLKAYHAQIVCLILSCFSCYLHGTVGSDEKFQIRSKNFFFEISGPGPSYTSLGTSQVHIWSYFEQLCWGAPVQCGGVGKNGLFWGISV